MVLVVTRFSRFGPGIAEIGFAVFLGNATRVGRIAQRLFFRLRGFLARVNLVLADRERVIAAVRLVATLVALASAVVKLGC
jgi:hypothetical protein